MKHVAAFVLVLSLVGVASGDVVYLKNGGSLEGQVVPTEDGVVVKLPAGEVRLSKEVIDRIEQKPSALDEYAKRAAAAKDGDAEAQFKLGAWARSVGLKLQARKHFAKVIAIEPNHAGARQALGYRLVGGKWLSEEEEMRARGLVKFEGEWMTPDAAAKLRALQAELEIAREKRRAAEADLDKAKRQAEAAKAAPPADAPIYAPNPYDYYYSTRGLYRSRSYYYHYPPAYVPYYISPYGAWRHYPGGRRYVPPSRRRH